MIDCTLTRLNLLWELGASIVTVFTVVGSADAVLTGETEGSRLVLFTLVAIIVLNTDLRFDTASVL